MWTIENRARYNGDHLRYPSDLTDEEWALIEPPDKPGGGKRRIKLREVVNELMYVLSTGCQEVNGQTLRERGYNIVSG